MFNILFVLVHKAKRTFDASVQGMTITYDFDMSEDELKRSIGL